MCNESVIRTPMSMPWWIKLTWVAHLHILCQDHTVSCCLVLEMHCGLLHVCYVCELCM